MRENRWKNKAERAAWIFYQLRLRGISAAALGRQMKPEVSRRIMSYVITDQYPGEKLARSCQEAIARFLEMGWEELWGDGAIQEKEQRRAG